MKSYAFTDHERLSIRTLDVNGRFHAMLETLQAWQTRARTRRELSGLSAAQLRDIGIDRIDADSEAAKPFWRG
jgi:uncharacterized protein YjiS (DUF1127 family)